MMKPGETVIINATILRVDSERVHAQTRDGQLIQTSVGNAEIKPENSPAQHKAILHAPENKSRRK